MKNITISLLVFFVVICMVGLASADQHHHGTQTPYHGRQFHWWRSFPWWWRVQPPPPSHHHHTPPSTPSPPTHHHHRHHPSPRHHMNPVPPPPPPPAAPVHYNQPPPAARFRDCSTALIYIDGCTRDLITSFFHEEKISVGGVCCRTISELSDDCFREAFMQFESTHFTRAVRDFCAHQL